MPILRYLAPVIPKDAFQRNKIAFITGPRQIGKTTCAMEILSKNPGEYFTWDDDDFRKIWLQSPKTIMQQLLSTVHVPLPLLVLDEIHKHRLWKTTLKGLYDLHKEKIHLLVTGSARLDFYRKSGDSLQGRYLPYRLHPLSVGETAAFVKAPPTREWLEHAKSVYPLEDLESRGGFPEPFLEKGKATADRWRRLQRERIVREDLRDIAVVRDQKDVENLAVLLETVVGGGLSYKSLQEDLKVSYAAVENWITLLEALYYCYRIKPYSQGVRQSLRKEPKLYLFDWAAVTHSGARLENLVASHLMKATHFWTDTAKGEFELYYLRDKQKREVDFLVTRDRRPWLMVECKSGQTHPTEALLYFSRMLKPQFSFQLVRKKSQERAPSLYHSGIQVIEVERFLSALP